MAINRGGEIYLRGNYNTEATPDHTDFARILGAKENSTSNNDAGYLSFITRQGVFAGSFERMRITSFGNVGIGTTAPNAKLAITGNVGIGVSFGYTAAIPVNGLAVEGNVGIGTTSPRTSLEVIGGGTFSSFFLNGNVGIGNTIPGAALEITGNLLFTKEATRTISVANTTTANTNGAALNIRSAAATGSGK